MIIERVSVSNFRNFDQLELSFSPGVNIFYGDNGSGKTNLLEAIFVLTLGRSQRGAQDTFLVRDTQDVFRIEGDVQLEDQKLELATAYQRGGRKKITINHLTERIAVLYEKFCAVSIGPEDSEIISGSPSVRREFLDIYLSQFSRSYISCLTDYRKVLAQKNAALKMETDPSPFDELLVKVGSKLIKERLDFIGGFAATAGEYYYRLSEGDSMVISYQPSVSLSNEECSLSEIEEDFRRQLDQISERERIMRSSMLGPHRDDMKYEIGCHPARSHSSQGERRTAAVASKLAVYDLLKSKRDQTPLLLLDEVFAELDNKRTDALVKAFADFGQLFLTTAIEPPDLLNGEARRFRVVDGCIEDIH